MKNTYLRFLTVSAMAVAAAVSLKAGGWSVITLSEFPDQARYGEPLVLNFTVRQHGITLIDGLTPKISTSMTDGPAFEVRGVPAGTPGRYEATLKFPKVGDWTIRIDGGFNNANDTARTENSVTLPPLTVVPQASESRVAYSEAERGGRLFVAKGCITCHRAGTRDLAGKRFDASYLKAFLADPSIRTMDMPNLGLREHEIAALTAFIGVR